MSTRNKYKKYNLLIEEVSSFNKEAGRILKSFKYLSNSNKFKRIICWNYSDLLSTFVWSESPQGARYWQNVYESLVVYRRS